MSLAYSILAHKSAGGVERLFRTIYHPDDIFVLHFDRRSDDTLHALGRKWAQRHSNVIILPSRAVLWGGALMAETQIEAMDAALVHSPHWSHFLNLTGQDFPLKSRSEIIDRLSANHDRSFVSWFDPLAGTLWKNARERLTRYYLEWPWLVRLFRVPGLGRHLQIALGLKNSLPHIPLFHRRWPDFFRYFGGANHVVLTREACEYLNFDPDARRIIDWLRHSAHANEIIFQSVLLNSPLAPKLINAHLRDIVFPTPDSPHPITLTMADLPRLLASPALFARKFDPAVDAAVLDALAERVLPASVLQS